MSSPTMDNQMEKTLETNMGTGFILGSIDGFLGLRGWMA